MSDFFANLAGRLDGSVPILRPRLPALFETPAADARLPPARQEPVEETTVVEAPLSARPRAQRAQEPSPPAQEERRPPRTPAPKAQESASDEPQAATPQPTRHRAQAFAPPPTPPQPPVATQTADAAPPAPKARSVPNAQPEVAAPQQQPAQTTAPQVPRARDSAPPFRDAAPSPTRREPEAAAQTRAEPARRRGREPLVEPVDAAPIRRPKEPAAAQQPANISAARPLASVPEKELQRVVAAPRPPFAPPPPLPVQPGRNESIAALRRPSEAASAEPTIHVTIGRIDIRAAAEAPAPRKSAASSPVMSLEDYLRSRAK